jgi:hypothetical protein
MTRYAATEKDLHHRSVNLLVGAQKRDRIEESLGALDGKPLREKVALLGIQ